MALTLAAAGCAQTTSVGVGGPSTTPDPTHREATAYAAIVRYELSAFRLTTTATPVYIENQLVSASVLSVQRLTLPALPTPPVPLRSPSPQPQLTTSPAGLIPADVQAGISTALSPAPVHFVQSLSEVPTQCGQGHVLGLRFGTLPPAGNRARVFVSAGDLPQVVGSEGFVDLAFDGSAWSVAPVPDPLASFLGGCG